MEQLTPRSFQQVERSQAANNFSLHEYLSSLFSFQRHVALTIALSTAKSYPVNRFDLKMTMRLRFRTDAENIAASMSALMG